MKGIYNVVKERKQNPHQLCRSNFLLLEFWLLFLFLLVYSCKYPSTHLLILSSLKLQAYFKRCCLSLTFYFYGPLEIATQSDQRRTLSVFQTKNPA